MTPSFHLLHIPLENIACIVKIVNLLFVVVFFFSFISFYSDDRRTFERLPASVNNGGILGENDTRWGLPRVQRIWNGYDNSREQTQPRSVYPIYGSSPIYWLFCGAFSNALWFPWCLFKDRAKYKRLRHSAGYSEDFWYHDQEVCLHFSSFIKLHHIKKLCIYLIYRAADLDNSIQYFIFYIFCNTQLFILYRIIVVFKLLWQSLKSNISYIGRWLWYMCTVGT